MDGTQLPPGIAHDPELRFETWIDKADWGDGVWKHEPDRLEWRDKTTGLPCLLRRGPGGAWCGYVGLPPGHPWHGLDLDDIPAGAHGGLNYAAPCEGGDTPLRGRICHTPLPGEPSDVFWVGFDCAHEYEFGDLCPSRHQRDLRIGWAAPNTTYRDIAFAANECTRIAAEAGGVARPNDDRV